MKRTLTLTTITVITWCSLFMSRAWAHIGFGVVVDKQGRVIFMDGSRILRLDPDNRLATLATDKHGNNLVSDPYGNLYVENFNETLWKITPDGEVIEVKLRVQSRHGFGALDELLAVDREGNFYFSKGNEFFKSDPQILKMTPDGQASVLAGSTSGHADGKGGEAKFRYIASAAWGPDGALYVTDARRIRKVMLDGTVTTLATSLGEEETIDLPLGGLLGLAVDAQENVYVADSGKKRIWKITPQGQTTPVMCSESSWVPVGVAVAENLSDASMSGDVYIIECLFLTHTPIYKQWWLGTHRAQKVSPDGKTTILVTLGRSVLGVATGTGVGFIALASVISGWWMWRRRPKRGR